MNLISILSKLFIKKTKSSLFESIENEVLSRDKRQKISSNGNLKTIGLIAVRVISPQLNGVKILGDLFEFSEKANFYTDSISCGLILLYFGNLESEYNENIRSDLSKTRRFLEEKYKSEIVMSVFEEIENCVCGANSHAGRYLIEVGKIDQILREIYQVNTNAQRV